MILSVAKRTQRDFFAAAVTSGKPQLLTISFSHYCEMARLALDLRKDRVEYVVHRTTCASIAEGKNVR